VRMCFGARAILLSLFHLSDLRSFASHDWVLPDPKGQSLEGVRAIRDEIHDRVKELIRSECAERCKAA